MDKVLLMEQRLSVQILLQSGRCEKNYIHPHLMKYIGNLRIWAKRSDVQTIKRKNVRDEKKAGYASLPPVSKMAKELQAPAIGPKRDKSPRFAGVQFVDCEKDGQEITIKKRWSRNLQGWREASANAYRVLYRAHKAHKSSGAAQQKGMLRCFRSVLKIRECRLPFVPMAGPGEIQQENRKSGAANRAKRRFQKIYK